MPVHQLKVLTWNANSLITKHNELEVLANEEKIDIILVQESKLNKRSPPKISGYSAVNKPNGRHYGLISYISHKINYTELDVRTTSCENQIQIIDDIAVINIYNSQLNDNRK